MHLSILFILIPTKIFCMILLHVKSNNPPWVFFTFLKLYKWYQITQTHYKSANIFIKTANNHLDNFFFFCRRIWNLNQLWKRKLTLICKWITEFYEKTKQNNQCNRSLPTRLLHSVSYKMKFIVWYWHTISIISTFSLKKYLHSM